MFLTGVEMDVVDPPAGAGKNALFAGDVGCGAWARIASLIETAKMNATRMPTSRRRSKPSPMAIRPPRSIMLPWVFTR